MKYDDFVNGVSSIPCVDSSCGNASAVVRRVRNRKRNKRLMLSALMLVCVGVVPVLGNVHDENKDLALWNDARPEIKNPSQQQWIAYQRSQQRKQFIMNRFGDLKI